MGGKKRKKPIANPAPPTVPPSGLPVGKLEPLEAREAIGEGSFKGGSVHGPKGKFVSLADRGRMPAYTKHENMVGWWLEQRYGKENVASQVDIIPHTRSDHLVVDYVVRNPETGKLEYYDAKTTEKASKYGQNLKYEALGTHGGTVRSSKHNLPEWLENGQELKPGSKIEKIRKDNRDIAKIKEAIKSTQKGNTRGDRGGKTKDRGTGDKGTGDRTGRTKSSGTTSKGAVKQRLGKARSAIKKGALAAKSGSVRLAKTRLSFRGNLVLDLAKAALFGILEGKLNKVNQEGISRDYASQVYEPQIDKVVQIALESAPEWAKMRSMQHKRRYIPHSYAVYMEQQAKSLSDAIINIARSFSFVEVYVRLEAFDNQGDYFQDWSKLRDPIEVGKRRKTSDPNIVKYIYTNHLLVWDPLVFKEVQNLKAYQAKAKMLMVKAREKALVKTWLPSDVMSVQTAESSITALLDKYEFLGAYNELQQSNSALLKRIDTVFLEKTILAGEKVITRAERFKAQQKTLLIMHLNSNPFTKLRKRIKREESQKALDAANKLMMKRPAGGGKILF